MQERPPGLTAWLQELRRSWWVLLLIAAALTLLMVDLDSSPRRLVLGFVVNLVVATGIGGTTSALYIFVLERLEFPARWWSWLVHAVAVAIGVVVGTELSLLALRPLLDRPDSMEIRVGIWQVGAVVSTLVLAFGFTYERLREHARQTELTAERAQRELLRAQLDNLHARLDPHFLFNSLNTVAALIEEDPQKAVAAVERLSALLRYSLEGTRREAVALSREVDAIEGFLEIERLRYGERLRSSIEVDPEVATFEVPPLLLQPLVENAVRHGVGRRRDGGTVQVRARREADRVWIEVADDGLGSGEPGGTQLGEATVRERLRLAYGEASSFESGPDPEGGYRVSIALPVPEATCG